jgi:hypothetical protein
MTPAQMTRLIYDPTEVLVAAGFTPDPWQREFLRAHHPQSLLNVCRQGGKSRAVSALAIHTALFTKASTTLILSPGQRQSTEVFHKIIQAYNALERPIKAEYETQLKLELKNGSRVLCLPGKEETVRAYSPELILIDEASRVHDDLYKAIRPMLTVSKGRLVALSTPFGQRGWFHREWHQPSGWHKVKVTAADHPRIGPEILDKELASMGQAWIDQEYMCMFTAMQGLVYPDFDKCLQPIDPTQIWGQHMGGIDWGWRNPFAAIWGTMDSDDTLWIYGERYLRQTPLHEHCKALPKILWYADPAGRTEIEELRAADHLVRRGHNGIRLGIAAISARIRDGRLKIDPERCPNLIAEANLYRYPDDKERIVYGENPIDDNNHALGALRYLISRTDAKFLAKLRNTQTVEGQITETEDSTPNPKTDRKRTSVFDYFKMMDEDTWTTIN